MAILQDADAPLVPGLKEALEEHYKTGKAINFPRHHGGHHVKEQTDPALKNCPQITTDALPLVTNKHEPKPCQTCAFCLPTGAIR